MTAEEAERLEDLAGVVEEMAQRIAVEACRYRNCVQSGDQQEANLLLHSLRVRGTALAKRFRELQDVLP